MWLSKFNLVPEKFGETNLFGSLKEIFVCDLID